MRHVAVLDPHDPVAHRAEQRLDDDVAAQLLERQHRIVVSLAHDRRRRGYAGLGAASRSPTTCRPSARSRAGMLTHRTPSAVSTCSTSTRKMTCSSEPRGSPRTISRSSASSTAPSGPSTWAWPVPSTSDCSRVAGIGSTFVTAIGERREQSARMPRAGRAKHANSQPRVTGRTSARAPRARARRHGARRPDSVLVRVTAAGLNSIGSTS